MQQLVRDPALLQGSSGAGTTDTWIDATDVAMVASMLAQGLANAMKVLQKALLTGTSALPCKGSYHRFAFTPFPHLTRRVAWTAYRTGWHTGTGAPSSLPCVSLPAAGTATHGACPHPAAGTWRQRQSGVQQGGEGQGPTMGACLNDRHSSSKVSRVGLHRINGTTTPKVL